MLLGSAELVVQCPRLVIFPQEVSAVINLSSCAYIIHFSLKLCIRLLCLLSYWPPEVHDGTTEENKNPQDSWLLWKLRVWNSSGELQ